MQAAVGSVQTINKIEYHVLPFFLPGVSVDAYYNSEHNNANNNALNKRGTFHCRAMIQSPSKQILVHPILLDFIEQTLEYAKSSNEQPRHGSVRQEAKSDRKNDEDHLDTM